MDPTAEGRPALMDRLLRSAGKALRAARIPIVALVIFAVLAFLTVFVLSALVVLGEGFS